MKIGLPKIRFSRKTLLISVGMLALLAGSGAAALYAGAGASLLRDKPEDSPIGGECTTVQTMVLKTPARRLWLRKYIRMEHADGATRIKTALRVAGLLAKANTVDLVQVNVLDASGPTVRAEMRGRAIGAEVVIGLQPKYLPDMKEPFIVRYFEGMPSDDGHYYGERVSLDLPEIQKLMRAMKDVPDKQDCAELPRPEEKSSAHEGKKPSEHVVSTAGEAPSGHEAKPADAETKAGEHGAPAEEGADATGHEAVPKKEQSFLDSVLGLVGLGGSEEKPAENHEAKTDDSPAVADDAIEPAPKPENHAAEPVAKEDASAAETNADTVGHEPVKAKDKAEKQVEAEPAGHDAKPVEKAAH